jgi:hypothetical protein
MLCSERRVSGAGIYVPGSAASRNFYWSRTVDRQPDRLAGESYGFGRESYRVDCESYRFDGETYRLDCERFSAAIWIV